MNHFALSFCYMLVHSLWQCALLLLGYKLLYPNLKSLLPARRKNILFAGLGLQWMVSLLTFSLYFWGKNWILLDEAGYFPEIVLHPDSLFFANLIWYLYAAVAVTKGIHTCSKWQFHKNNFRKQVTKPAPRLKLFTDLRALEMGISKKVQLWYSASVTAPVTFGHFKPVILLPFSLMSNLSISEVESLIIHELSHIKQHDYLFNWFLLLTETLFFYNPFIYILGRHIRLERELQADTQVMHYRYTPICYAETLLKIARIRNNIPVFQLPAVASKSQLYQRIAYFTAASDPSKTNKQPWVGFLLMMPLLLFIILLTWQIFLPAKEENKVTTIPYPSAYQVKILPATKNNSFHERDELKKGGLSSTTLLKRENLPVALKHENTLEKEKVDVNALPEETLQVIGENYALPVAAFDIPKDKLVIVKEEDAATGITLTKAYTLNFNDGKWTPRLVWIMNEFKPKTDSCGNAINDHFEEAH